MDSNGLKYDNISLSQVKIVMVKMVDKNLWNWKNGLRKLISIGK